MSETCLHVAFDGSAICTREAGHGGSHTCVSADGEISIWPDVLPETWDDVVAAIDGAFTVKEEGGSNA